VSAQVSYFSTPAKLDVLFPANHLYFSVGRHVYMGQANTAVKLSFACFHFYLAIASYIE
jgi:hypothetical protein